MLVQTTKKFDSEIAVLTDKIKGSTAPDGTRIDGLHDLLPYRIVDKIARAQEKFVEITRAGRRGTPVVEASHCWRAESENSTLFYRRTIFKAMERQLHDLNKRLGADFQQDEIHNAVTISMLDNYEEAARRILDDPLVPAEVRALDISIGPLPDDEIWVIKKMLESNEKTRALLESPEVKAVAMGMVGNYTQFMVDMVRRGLFQVDANPARMYLPLQF